MTFDEARDYILGIFKIVWTPPRVAVYTDVAGEVPDGQVVWARPKLQHTDGNQDALTGGLGTIRWQRKGFLWIQIFSPQGAGGTAGYAAAQLLVNAYQSDRSSVWFRNIRMREMPPEGAFARHDVIADFEYTDVR